MSAIKIIADVERSADLCVNICKAARRIYGHELDPHLRGVIQKMGAQAQVLFKEATEAYLNLDGTRAAALHDMDAYLDDLHRQFIQIIFESHAAGNIDLQVAVQLAVVARFYERIGDHAVNVGDRTRYIVSGWVPDTPYAESDNDPPHRGRCRAPSDDATVIALVLAVVVGIGIGGAVGFGIGRRRGADGTAPARPAEPASSIPDSVDRRAASAPDDDRADDRAGDDSRPFAMHLTSTSVSSSVADGKIVYRNDAATMLPGDARRGARRRTHRVHPGVSVTRRAHGDAARRTPRAAANVAGDLRPTRSPTAARWSTIQDVTERMRTDAVRTDFVTNISHELKTPVGALAVLAEALIDEPDPEVVHVSLQRIVDEAHRAVRTIDDLLRLSQIESAAHRRRRRRSQLGRCSGDRPGRIADGGRGVTSRWRSTRPTPIRGVRAIGRQLVSAVGNLVENAVKYSNDGGVVQVRTRLTERVGRGDGRRPGHRHPRS